ncbi:MAG: 50S ribosomal protein L6 [Clostridia bacterium]|nr:50S ribosomal protein L6 [Clostridia bacterium]
MSRIGRMPVEIPAGVTVTVAAGNVVTVAGPLGTLTETLCPRMTLKQEGNVITVERPSDEKEDRSLHGLTRALLNNMVVGVSQGYKKQLDIVGVGYRVIQQGKTITFNLGHSHTISFTETDLIKFEVPNPNTVIVKGINKQEVGQMAAVIRSKRPPEPYHGKGVKYSDEHIRRKAGKTGGKGK